VKYTKAVYALLLLSAACVLPEFKKVEPADASSGKACGLSDKLPKGCNACIQESCCDLAKACGHGTACGRDLLEPITPAADFSEDFDPLLGCLQRFCDQACDVSWGCVGNYSVPAPMDPYSIGVHVIDFAADPEMSLPDVTVSACNSVDPACQSGKVVSQVTDGDGNVALSVTPSFDGFFSLSGGGYASSTVQWSEPLYRISGFTQYQLTDASIGALAVVTGVHQSFDQPFDPNVGHMIFRIQSCLPLRYLGNSDFPRAEASDVRVRFEPNDGATSVFYTDKSGGVALALEATSSNGFGGAFNLPARNLSVTAVDSISDRTVATGTVVIRPGTVGFIYLVPNSTR
jgi:hypothetical protein